MKSTFTFLVLFFSAIAIADTCNVVIRDQYGQEFDDFITTSYSVNAACDDASWNCQQRLSDHQSNGQYYNARCVIKEINSAYYPPSYPPNYPPSYPPNYPHDPREPREPREPRDPREPPRNAPGSGPRYPVPGPMGPRR